MIINKSNIDQFIEGALLYCSNIGLTSIEDIPDYITIIYCQYNELTQLPKLPSGLKQLYCHDNKLTSLPMLPDSLVYLFCDRNKLTSYPERSDDHKQWMVNHNNQLKLDNRIEIINKINDYQ